MLVVQEHLVKGMLVVLAQRHRDLALVQQVAAVQAL